MVIVALALVACGSDDSDSSSSGGNAAKSGEEIKIGVEAGLTGASNQIGVPYVNGAKLAAEDLNKDKDTVLDGGSVKLVTADTETEAVPAVQAAQKLVSVDKVDALICSCYTLMMLPMSDALKKKNIVIISDATSSPVIRDMPGNILSTIGTDDVLGGIMAKWAHDLGHQKAALVYGNDTYGTTFRDAVKKAYEDAGGEIALDLKVDLELSDYAPEMKRILDSGADAVLMGTYTDDARLQARQLQQLGWKGDLFKLYPSATEADKEADNHLFGVDLAHNKGERAKEFSARYKEVYGDEPSVWAAIGYDAAYLAALGVVNAKSDSADDIEQTIRDQTATYEGVTGKIEFDEDGVRTNPDVGFFKQMNGKLATVDESGQPTTGE